MVPLSSNNLACKVTDFEFRVDGDIVASFVSVGQEENGRCGVSMVYGAVVGLANNAALMQGRL